MSHQLSILFGVLTSKIVQGEEIKSIQIGKAEGKLSLFRQHYPVCRKIPMNIFFNNYIQQDLRTKQV